MPNCLLAIEQLFADAKTKNDIGPMERLVDRLMEADHYLARRLATSDEPNIYREFFHTFHDAKFLTFNYDFWGPFYTIREVLPQMKQRRFGRMVNIASIGGKVAFPHLRPYSTSKFALVGYSEGLRAELAKYNILVTTVRPGLMRTGSPRNAEFTGQAEKEYAWFAISDSLPVASIGARRAARKIIDACIHGEAEIHLGVTAKLGALVQGCAPGATAELLALVDRLMPEALPGRASTQKGTDSESGATANLSTTLTREAEIANNQL